MVMQIKCASGCNKYFTLLNRKNSGTVMGKAIFERLEFPQTWNASTSLLNLLKRQAWILYFSMWHSFGKCHNSHSVIAKTEVLGTNATEGVYGLQTPLDILLSTSIQSCRIKLFLSQSKDWWRQERHRWTSTKSVYIQSYSRVTIGQV